MPKWLSLLLQIMALLLSILFSAALLLASGAVLTPAPLLAKWQALTAPKPVSQSISISQSESLPAAQSLPPLSPSVRLNVRNILQNPELPNGCEATALAVLLRYLGYPADKMDIAYVWLPRQDFIPLPGGQREGPSPEQAYPGNPGVLGGGYYCYPPVVAFGANAYLGQNGGEYSAMDISGANEQALLTLLDAGLPLMVWKTTDGEPPRIKPKSAWLLPTGEAYEPYANLHVVVLSGYDERYFYFCDPLLASSRMERQAFMHNYKATGKRAVAFARTQPVSSAPAVSGASAQQGPVQPA